MPLAHYDRDKAAWIPTDDGRVIKILSITSGVAQLDTTGDGNADNGTALGITEAERQQLASLYPVGKTLSRMPVTHFTRTTLMIQLWRKAGLSPQEVDKEEVENKDQKKKLDVSSDGTGGNSGGSAGTQAKQGCKIPATCSIECENQILGERISLVGTGWA